MKKLFISLIAGLAIFGGIQNMIANAAPITPPYGGGTGTSTAPAVGSILVGLNGTQYCVLPVGSNGQVPIASSTAPCGIAWGNVSGTSGGSGSSTTVFGVSPIVVTGLSNGNQTTSCPTCQVVTSTLIASGTATGPAFTLATSTASGKFNIACNGSTCTVTIPSNVGFFANDSGYLISAILSLNGMSNANQSVVCASGCSIATSSSGANATTSITINFPSQVATTTITASGTTLNGPSFTLGSTSIIQPYASGSIFYWNITTSTILAGYATSSNAGTGSCTNCNVTVNGNGIVTSIANGSAGGGGSVSTSSAVTANFFPYWFNTTGGLSGTSTIFASSSGFIGINTTTTPQPLTVGGNIECLSTGACFFILNRNASSNFAVFQFQDNGTTVWSVGPRNDGTDKFHVFADVNNTDTIILNPANSTVSINWPTNVSGTISQNGTAVVLQTRNVNSGGILSGGGDLSADRTISFSTSTLYSEFSGTSPISYNNLTGAFSCATCATTSNVSGTINNIAIFTGANTVGNSSLSQSGGATFLNGTQIIDGGANWTSNVIQSSGSNVISQAPTSTASLGNLVQNGGVQNYSASTTITAAQFCGGGEIIVTSSTGNVVITLPSLTQIASTTLSPCASSIYAGSFAQQFLINSSTNNVTVNTSGTNEIQLYSPGTPTVLSPGQSWFIQGQFVNTSTVQGATATSTVLKINYSLYQTSTIANALVLANGNGGFAAYGGAAACSAGQAVTTISATGGTTCAAFSTLTTSTLNTLYLQIANNLSDLTNTSTARTNLGLGTSATHNVGDFAQTANNGSDFASTSTTRTNLGLKATSSIPVADANGIQTSFTGSSFSPASGCISSISLSATATLSGATSTCSGGSGLSSFNGNSGPSINFNVVGDNINTTTTVATSGGNTTTTVKLTNSGVASGTYTYATITVASSGIVSSASNGTSPITSFNGDTTAAQKITSDGTIGTSTSSGVTTLNVKTSNATIATSTSGIAVNCGKYMDCTNGTSVSSTLASSSATFNFAPATTTTGFNFATLYTANAKTIALIDCGEEAAATTTVEVGYATTSAKAAGGIIGQVILNNSNFTCGNAGNSTTTFTTSTLPAASWLIVLASSTLGTSQHLIVDVAAQVQ